MDGTTGSERVLAHIHTVERAMSGRLHGGDLKLMSWFVDRMKAAAEADSRTLDAYAAEGLDPVKAFRVAPPKTPAKFYICETKPLRRLSDAGWGWSAPCSDGRRSTPCRSATGHPPSVASLR